MRGSVKQDLRVGETLQLRGDGVTTITLLAKTGQRSRLEIVADETVRINVLKETKPAKAPLGLGPFPD
ncbi:MAG: hypothetical protein EOM21_19450 [Gammaproteobacteria bacterium]|nr:hypothetical protein [Gammaproteobacteria bacterium]